MVSNEASAEPLSCPSKSPVMWSLNLKPLPKSSLMGLNRLSLNAMKRLDEGLYTCEGTDEEGYKFLGIAFVFILG